MKVINIHKRIIDQPHAEIAALFSTLATKNDMMLATHKWPPMILDKGLQVGSKGGHGPIRYFVTEFQPGRRITFQFDMAGFNGFHRFDITPLDEHQTELTHLIDMETSGLATIKWAIGIRWLHDALIEDAMDRIENHFSDHKKRTEWNIWVRFLRKVMQKPNKPHRTYGLQ